MNSFTITSLLFASTLLLPIDAFPTLAKRATNAPKIGFELECRQLDWTSTNPDLTEKIPTKDVKGKELFLPGITNKAQWKPTAEIFLKDVNKVTTEIIIDGGSATQFRGVPLVPGEDVGARLGKEIFTYITSAVDLWKDGGAAGKAQIDGFTGRNPELYWQLDTKGQKLTPEQLGWALQVTAPFPLGRLVRIIPSMKLKPRGKSTPEPKPEPKPEHSELVPTPKFEMVPSCLFPYKGNQGTEGTEWTDANITDDVRAYVSLLMAYINAAKSANLEDGPKHAISIMPRTDFKSMYTELVKGKIQDIVKEMSNKKGYWNTEKAAKGKEYQGTTITDFTSWMYAICVSTEICENPAPKPGRKWDTTSDFSNIKIGYKSRNKDKDVPSADVPSADVEPGYEYDAEDDKPDLDHAVGPTVKRWLDGIDNGIPGVDLVTAADKKHRGGQIGSLKNTFEYVIGSSREKLPIFEFRDIAGQTTEKLEGWLAKVEADIRAAHRGHRTLGKRAAATTPKKKHDKKKGGNPGCIRMSTTSTTSSATSTKTSASTATPATATTTPANATPTTTTAATSTDKSTPTPKATPAANTKSDELAKKRQELLDRQAANETAKNNLSKDIDTKIDEKNEKEGKKNCSGKGLVRMLCKAI